MSAKHDKQHSERASEALRRSHELCAPRTKPAKSLREGAHGESGLPNKQLPELWFTKENISPSGPHIYISRLMDEPAK